MISAGTVWSAPDRAGLAGYGGGGYAPARRRVTTAHIGRIGFAGGTAIVLWLLWPVLGLAALAVPPFLLLATAFACGFLVVAARHLAAGRPLADLIARPADHAVPVLLGVIGPQLLGLLALALIFPAGAAVVADPWPVLGTAFRGLTGWPALGPDGGVALGYVLGLSGLLCWLVSDAARRRRGGAPNFVGGLYGWAAVIGLVLHLCLEPRLPLTMGSLLAAAAIGLGPLGLAPLLWSRRRHRRP